MRLSVSSRFRNCDWQSRTPRPAHRLYFLQFFTDETAAFAFVEAVREADLATLSLEFADRQSLAFAATSPAAKHNRLCSSFAPKFGAAVFVELPFDDETELESGQATLLDLVEAVRADSGASFAGIEDKDLREAKEFRHAIPERINAIIAARKREIPELHKISTDMAVPDGQLDWVYQMYRDALKDRFEFAVFGHAGNNHLHVNILPRTREELREAKELYPKFAAQIVARGGSIAGEHGIGRIKRELMRLQYNREEIETLWQIKRFFDPQLLLAPEVLLPEI